MKKKNIEKSPYSIGASAEKLRLGASKKNNWATKNDVKKIVKEELIPVNKKLSGHNQKFDKVFKKLSGHNQKFDKVFKKLDDHDQKFDQVIKMLIEHDGRLDRIERVMMTKKDGEKLELMLEEILKWIPRSKEENKVGAHQIRKLQDNADKQKIISKRHEKDIYKLKAKAGIA